MHDMVGAQQIFDSVLADRSIAPGACLYQAIFESMVANHRVADTEPLLSDMASRRVEMTAYIANTLIHGWANEKNITKSEAIYASLGHEKREPSTYEAMTRAYLAVEDRISAERVVTEMLTRRYPHAVSSKVVELVSGGSHQEEQPALMASATEILSQEYPAAASTNSFELSGGSHQEEHSVPMASAI